LYIAGYLREKLDNASIRVIDGAKIGFRKTLQNIKDADITGISFTTWSSPGAFNLINKIKENNSDTFIVAGGAHPSALPNEVLMKSKTDAVVIGEGEETFLEIAKHLENNNLKNINGIAFRKKNKIIITKRRKLLDLNSIPFPDRDLVDIKSYPGLYWSKKQPETNIISSRGCLNNCVFCSNPVWKTSLPWLRLRSPENIAEEVELLKNKFGIKEVSDECDTFNVNLDWAIKVCKKMKEVDVPWKAQIRANVMNDNLAKSMADSGCWLVRIGIESANPATLKGIRKGITIDQVVNTCKKLKKYDIKIVGLFMIFNVWEENNKLRYENVKMCENTIRFVKKLLDKRLLDSFSWALATPFPGSELYRIARKYNLIENEDYNVWNQASNFIMKLPDIKNDDIKRIKMKGVMLQGKSMITCQGFNPRVIKLYFQRAYYLSKIFLNQLKN
jgi:radical SAM superfamily enzyme YgiQ (UPF0313 family)